MEGNVKIIKHGKSYTEDTDRFMACKTCGCEFYYNREDINCLHQINEMNYSWQIIQKGVICPECFNSNILEEK